MIKKFFIVVSVPVISIIVVLLISYSCKKWENPLIAAGTVGAAIAAVWAIIYLEIIKAYFDRPILEIKEPGFEQPFYRRAPEINEETGRQGGIGYYINLLLINIGKRTAKNCQPLLTSMWRHIEDRWEHIENWIPVALKWAMGEDHEYVKDVQKIGVFKKLREERNLIPQRPYYFNLGCISTTHADELRILQLIFLTAQSDKVGPGEYCFEVTVTGEEVDLPPKYFYVIWRGGCTDNLKEVEQRFEVSMKDYPPF